MSDPNRGPIVTAGISAAAAALLLTGCSGGGAGPEDSAVASTSAAVSSVSAAISSAQKSPDHQIVTDHVQTGPIGALRNEALTIAGDVSEYSATAADVNKAYGDAARIPVPVIRNATDAYISWLAADNTTVVDQHIYTYAGYDDSDGNDKQTVTAAEQLVDAIRDPSIKSVADKNLDYVEAQAAVKAGTGSSPNQALTTYLLSTVENPSILAVAKKEIGANTPPDTDFLNDDAQKLNESIDTSKGNAFSALYDGSNEQADNINREITDFNKARSATGN